METELEVLNNKIKALEEENMTLKEHLKKYTAPARCRKYYQDHKEDIKEKVKKYVTSEKRQEYNKRYYEKKKSNTNN